MTDRISRTDRAHHRPLQRRPRSAARLAAVTAAAMIATRAADAGDIFHYNTGVGVWFDDTKWDAESGGHGVPGGNDIARIEFDHAVVDVQPYVDPSDNVFFAAANKLFIGNNAVASLNTGLDSHGNAVPHHFSATELTVGSMPATTGTYLQDKSLTSTSVGTMYLGAWSNATGRVALTFGTMSSTTTAVGYLGTGVFTHNGGAFTSDDMDIGFEASGHGTYDLAPTGRPDAILASFGGFTVGRGGTGTFNQSGGAVQFVPQNGAATFTAGMLAGSTATVNVNAGVFGDPGGVPPNAVIAEGGTAVFNLNGAGATANFGTVWIADHNNGTPGNGTLNLTAGTFDATTLTVGRFGTGAVNYSSPASLHVTSPGDNALILADQTGSSGTFDFDAPLLEVGVPGDRDQRGDVTVGNYGTAVFLQHQGAFKAHTLNVGYANSGTYRAFAGSLDLTGDLNLGTNSQQAVTGFGQVYLGTTGNPIIPVTIDGDVRVGAAGGGRGMLWHYGGTTATVNGALSVDAAEGLTSIYRLWGSLSVEHDDVTKFDAATETIASNADGGTAIFFQFAGSTNRANHLRVGGGAGAGTDNLNGGSLYVRDDSTVAAGGAFKNLLGAANETGALLLEGPADRAPTYELRGTLTVGHPEYVPNPDGTNNNGNVFVGHHGGVGSFTQSGGTLTATVSLTVDTGSAYALAGGTLTVPTVTVEFGGSYQQFAGNATVTNFTNRGDANLNTFLGPSTLTATTIVNESSATFGNFGATVATASLTNRGTFTHGGGTLNAGATVNDGQFNVNGGTASVGPLSGGGNTSVGGAGGAATLNAHSIRQNSLTVGASGNVHLTPDQTADGTSVVDALSIDDANGAKIDLAKNHLIVNYGSTTPYADIKHWLTVGRNGGSWNGAGLSSSAAAADPADFALGYADAGTLGITSFGGQSVGSAVLARWTLLGDATLDGTVNFNDLARLSQHYNGPGDWEDGDFDYNGVVDFTDLVALSQHYNMSLPPPAAPVPAALLASAVPEPASAATLLAAAATLGLRVRRRRPPLAPPLPPR